MTFDPQNNVQQSLLGTTIAISGTVETVPQQGLPAIDNVKQITTSWPGAVARNLMVNNGR